MTSTFTTYFSAFNSDNQTCYSVILPKECSWQVFLVSDYYYYQLTWQCLLHHTLKLSISIPNSRQLPWQVNILTQALPSIARAAFFFFLGLGLSENDITGINNLWSNCQWIINHWSDCERIIKLGSNCKRFIKKPLVTSGYLLSFGIIIRKQTLRRLTFQCKITKIMLVMSLKYTPVMQSILCLIFSMCAATIHR